MTDSILHYPLETIRDLFAASTNWIAWTGAANAAAAEAYIYLISVSATGIKRPHLLIMNGDQYSLEKVGQPNTFRATGSVILRFEATAASLTSSTNEETICALFLDKVGYVLSDVLDTAAPTLDIKSISRRGSMARSTEEQYSAHGNIVQLEFELQW